MLYIKRMLLMEFIYAIIVGIVLGIVFDNMLLGLLIGFGIGGVMVIILLTVQRYQQKK